jgi:hypothetical protein
MIDGVPENRLAGRAAGTAELAMIDGVLGTDLDVTRGGIGEAVGSGFAILEAERDDAILFRGADAIAPAVLGGVALAIRELVAFVKHDAGHLRFRFAEDGEAAAIEHARSGKHGLAAPEIELAGDVEDKIGAGGVIKGFERGLVPLFVTGERDGGERAGHGGGAVDATGGKPGIDVKPAAFLRELVERIRIEVAAGIESGKVNVAAVRGPVGTVVARPCFHGKGGAGSELRVPATVDSGFSARHGKLQIPSSKLQRSSNLQIPNRKSSSSCPDG